MNALQMVGVLLLLSLLVMLYANAMNVDINYIEALSGLAVLKGIALFLIPEKAPMVFVKRGETEEDAN